MGRITYRNARIWDGVAADYLGIGAVAVENGIIVAVDEDADGDEVRDMSGLTLVPGLIDAHVHMTLDPALRTPDEQLAATDDEVRRGMIWRAEEMVRAGITTARDLGGGKWLEIDLRNRVNAGELTGPRLLCAGQPVTSVGGHCHFWGGEARDVDAARGVIERQTKHGVDLIKIMATGGMMTKHSSPRSAQFDAASTSAIVRYANERGLDVAAHCHGTQGIAHAASAGVATIEHCSWLGDDGRRSGYDPDVAAEIARQGVWVSPTISAGWKRFTGGDGKFEKAVQGNFARMRAAGVRLIASTDAGIPNVRHQDLAKALPVFARFAGLTSVETLRSATSDCADALGLNGVTGRIAENHAADMVFVEGDPLTDIGALEAPVLVVARGKVLERES